MSGHVVSRCILILVAILVLPAASWAQVQVIVSGGFREVYREVLPEFERSTDVKVTWTTGGSQGTSPNTIGAQLRRGVPADVVIMNREGLRELIAEGRIAAGTDIDLAQTPLAMAVRAGTPKPDISTVNAFKQALLRVNTITLTNSTDGIYMTTTLFPKLGIGDAIAAKISKSGASGLTSGAAEIAVMPLSELLHVQGAIIVGTLPAEIQLMSVFAAAVVAGSKDAETAKKLIAFLASDAVTAATRKNGMERLGSR
jgi:molybdate transport system substrate-binding protein